MRDLDYSDFTALTNSILRYLSARVTNWDLVVDTILGDGQTLSNEERALVCGVLQYLNSALQGRRRRVVGWAVLHPIRAAAILARVYTAAGERVSVLALVTALLHDLWEDAGGSHEGALADLVKKLDPMQKWFLFERTGWLTKGDESYVRYLERLVESSRRTPETIVLKLVDRCDSTLDVRIEEQDPLEETDFDELLIRLLFVRGFGCPEPSAPQMPGSLDVLDRVSQLHKNTLLVSAMRGAGLGYEDEKVVFEATHGLLRASLDECRRIALHILGRRGLTRESARVAALDVLEKAWNATADTVSFPAERPLLKWLLSRSHSVDTAEADAARNTAGKDPEDLLWTVLWFMLFFHNAECSPRVRTLTALAGT